MPNAAIPELRKFMDKMVSLKLNGNRHVEGVLTGYDPFMNLVIGSAIEIKKDRTRKSIGSVVIRGNSVIVLDCKERL